MITQHQTGDHLLCPVHQWGAIIHHICSYPKSCDNTPANMILSPTNKKPQLIINIVLLDKLQSAATAVRKDVLGFDASELGLHSICTGATMSTYLTGVPVFMIMLFGCWSSDAFLQHIRKQVQEFSTGVSVKMIQQTAFSLYLRPRMRILESPDITTTLQTRNNCGCNTQSDSACPAFALWMYALHNKQSFKNCTYISNPHLSMAFCILEIIYVFPVESF